MAGIFGNIDEPLNNSYFNTSGGQGLFLFISNLFKFITVLAGIFMVVQFILAGYGYISANGDSKKLELAWAKIWQGLIGMIIIASAFVLAALIERLTGINIRSFQICGPNGCTN